MAVLHPVPIRSIPQQSSVGSTKRHGKSHTMLKSYETRKRVRVARRREKKRRTKGSHNGQWR